VVSTVRNIVDDDDDDEDDDDDDEDNEDDETTIADNKSSSSVITSFVVMYCNRHQSVESIDNERHPPRLIKLDDWTKENCRVIENATHVGYTMRWFSLVTRENKSKSTR